MSKDENLLTHKRIYACTDIHVYNSKYYTYYIVYNYCVSYTKRGRNNCSYKLFAVVVETNNSIDIYIILYK